MDGGNAMSWKLKIMESPSLNMVLEYFMSHQTISYNNLYDHKLSALCGSLMLWSFRKDLLRGKSINIFNIELIYNVHCTESMSFSRQIFLLIFVEDRDLIDFIHFFMKIHIKANCLRIILKEKNKILLPRCRVNLIYNPYGLAQAKILITKLPHKRGNKNHFKYKHLLSTMKLLKFKWVRKYEAPPSS